jgi:NAD(P)-dependent dehydrogenase (short-subunit alcohol dehydrogenase family)
MSDRALDGETVVVVGGSSGIGRAVAERVTGEGAEVVIGSRGADQRRETVSALGDAATGHPVDLADDESVAAFFDAVGPFDHLVLTAAYVPTGGFRETSPDELREAFEVKGIGYLRAAQAAADTIADDGSVTVISAISADEPSADYFALGMVNAAVEVLVRSVAVELAPVRANAVSPSTVDTWGMDEERKADMAAGLPAAHVGEPADVADAVAFCIRNPYLSGEVVRIDGGERLV